jgi:3'-phosphoadenosine 5'-phosphosulfate sulfotransferase (PAPS reductase)/FAD synthetase
VRTITQEDRERIDDSTLVVSVSGGKDSAALSLWLHEQGIEHERLFADTGWEHPLTYEYLRGPLQEAIGPINEVRAEQQMKDLIRKKKMFPSRLRRFCTTELKVKPLSRWMKSQDASIVNAVGVRAEESAARAKLSRWEYSSEFDADVWRPLLRWTEQEVIDIHHRHGLAPNPLYLKGATRVGCWPCIFSRKREIKLVADLSPERIDEIRQLEDELGDAAEERMKEDGRHRNRPTFFHPKGHDPERGDFVPIERVVEWARTSRGGKQMLMFDTEPPGCMRWGLCEAHSDAAE